MPEKRLPPKIFDRELVARHLRRRPPGHDDFVTRLVLADLDERLGTVTRSFEQAIILSPDASVLPTSGRSANGPFRFERASTVLEMAGVTLVDPEVLDLPRRGYDLIVSIFDLDVVDDVPGFLARARAHLRGDGLFLAAAIGGDSLTELREAFLSADAEIGGGAYLRVAPFIPLSEAAGLLQRAGLALPVSDVETHIVRYQSPLSLMRELKALGASNPLAERPDKPATLRLLQAATAAYERLAADPDGRVRATLEIIWMSGWAPHESQQKPLKPGSAQVRLADMLKTKN
ncbi:MAG: SAM-dependent methyltransferase [Devosia nanyangense]|uniref:SAM-dependent methyltransferase n=1 Tax=Devosia nanyangense TaxID=1228055 RepID=A0A933NY70_9HYPH|nr:SAM-dependent methyltransferase [Devosia nanyangense]